MVNKYPTISTRRSFNKYICFEEVRQTVRCEKFEPIPITLRASKAVTEPGRLRYSPPLLVHLPPSKLFWVTAYDLH